MKRHHYFTTVAGTLLLAAAAHAQTTPHQTSASTAPIGQAVSGNNSTAAGVSGTGLRTDGTAETSSKHGAAGREAAGVNKKGQVVHKSTSVLGVSARNNDNVNAQATNTTAPNNTDPNPPATGGRGEAGTKAEKEVIKANSRAVHSVPGSHLKTESAVKATEKKRAEERQKGAEKESAASTGS